MLYDTLIVGGGISGLTAAYRLYQSGFKICLLEQESYMGGKIRTLNKDGFILEAGPNTFLSKSRALVSLCNELGLQPLAASPASKKRYIYSQARLHALSSNPLEFVLSNLISVKAKLRLLEEPFIPPFEDNSCDETVASFIRRRMGDEILEKLVGPFVSGVFAGDPEQLSLKAVFPILARLEKESGSLTKGAFKALRERNTKSPTERKLPYKLMSFKDGMRCLPETIAQQLPPAMLRNSTLVEAVRLDKGEFCIFLSTGEMLRGRKLLLATPAAVTARLIKPFCPAAASELEKIPYAPLRVAHIGLEKTLIKHRLDGFGFLVTGRENLSILGSLWMSSLFANRTPLNKLLFTNMLGGACYPEVSNLEDSEVLLRTCLDLAKVFGLKELSPEFSTLISYTDAIPQYVTGHVERIKRIKNAVTTIDGLALTGNYLNGVSVGDCVEQANQVACIISEQLQKSISLKI